MNSTQRLTDQVKLLQKAVVTHQDKFLILQRSQVAHTRPSQWDLPGGNAVWPETTIDLKNPHLSDLMREIREETGLDLASVVQPSDLNLIHLSTYFEVQNNTYAVIVGYSLVLPAELSTDSIQLSSEHTNWAWISYDEFKTAKYDFGFAGGEDGFITQMIKAVYG